MTLIKKLVEIRLDTFIKEFDIDISIFDYVRDNRIISWEQVKQKFIKHNLITNNCNSLDCYLVIVNTIWKNIMGNYIDNNKWHVHMYHNNFKSITLQWFDYYPVYLMIYYSEKNVYKSYTNR